MPRESCRRHTPIIFIIARCCLLPGGFGTRIRYQPTFLPLQNGPASGRYFGASISTPHAPSPIDNGWPSSSPACRGTRMAAMGKPPLYVRREYQSLNLWEMLLPGRFTTAKSTELDCSAVTQAIANLALSFRVVNASTWICRQTLSSYSQSPLQRRLSFHQCPFVLNCSWWSASSRVIINCHRWVRF